MHIKRMTEKEGAVLAEHHRLSPSPEECAAPAQNAILHVDGGPIPIHEQDKRRCAAVAAMVYRPAHLHAVNHHRRQIMEQTCVVSAMDDHLHTIQASRLTAAHQHGMSHTTNVTALADGA